MLDDPVLDTCLIIPCESLIYKAEDDDGEGADLLRWWIEGNEGSANHWWNQLTKEEQESFQ